MNQENHELQNKIGELEKKIQTLEETEKSYRLFLDNIPTNLFSLDRTFIIRSVNNFCLASFGYTKEEYLEKSFFKFFDPDDKAKINKLFSSYNYDVFKSTESKFKTKNDSYHDVEILCKYLESQNSYSVIIRDISHRTKRRKQLEKEKKLLNALLNNVPDTIYFKDTNSKFTRINKAQADLLGLSSCDEAIGKSDHDYFPKEHADMSFDDEQNLFETKKTLISKREKLNLQGYEDKWVSATKVPIIDPDGRVTGLVGISRDVSDLVKAEKKILEYTKELQLINQSKDKFFSIIAHDLKNPFNSLLGFSELLMKNKSDFTEHEIDELIKRIYISSKNTYQLLENLLQWSRSQTGRLDFQPINFDLLAVVNECFALVISEARQKDLTIVNQVNENTEVFADFNMVETIIRNLLTNAIKFSEKGDTIKVYTKFGKNNKTIITVEDTGIGIPPDIMDKLFKIDEHHTTPGTNNESGTGLGLILCKEFIEKNGGEICVESEENKGSKFIFSLPSSS